MNENITRLELWAIDAITLDEAKVDMEENVRDAVEAMEEMAFWRIFPDLKGKYDKVKNTFFDAYAYVRDYILGKDTVSDVDWKKLEIGDLNMLYIYIKNKSWEVSRNG